MKYNYLISIRNILLAIILIIVHTHLWYWLRPDFELIPDCEITSKFDCMRMVEFSWLRLTSEKVIEAIIFGFLFGTTTAVLIASQKANHLYNIFIYIVSGLEGGAVFYLGEQDIEPLFKMAFASFHYAIYTAFIIIVSGRKRLKSKEKNNEILNYTKSLDKEYNSRTNNINEIDIKPNNEIEREIVKLLKLQSQGENIQGKDIAQKFGISESKVSRIKKRYKI